MGGGGIFTRCNFSGKGRVSAPSPNIVINLTSEREKLKGETYRFRFKEILVHSQILLLLYNDCCVSAQNVIYGLKENDKENT